MMKMMKMINAATAGTVFVYCIKFKFCLYFLFECSDYPLISFVFLRYFNLRTLVVWSLVKGVPMVPKVLHLSCDHEF